MLAIHLPQLIVLPHGYILGIDYMVDEADKADLYMQQMIDAAISNRHSPEIQGVYGECDDCGEEGRLVDGICVPCRKLIEDRNKRWR